MAYFSDAVTRTRQLEGCSNVAHCSHLGALSRLSNPSEIAGFSAPGAAVDDPVDYLWHPRSGTRVA